jgi:signal transduction histidine kinase
MHSLLGVPVRNKNRTLGNFYLTDKTGGQPFTDDDQRLVELFALHAGIAMDNARLHEAAGRLAVLEERDRIGKDLHDGIIQSIYGVSLSLEDVLELMDSDRDETHARVDRAIDALHGTIRDLRGFIFGLRPELVDETDLVGLLVALTEQLRQNSLVEVNVQLPEKGVTASPHVRAELLQIAREALSNVARHSGASEVDVALAMDGTTLVLDVTDNGRGFDPADVAPDGHFGLANMLDRAAALGGDLTISSAAGAGTHIIVRIPAADDHEARANDD